VNVEQHGGDAAHVQFDGFEGRMSRSDADHFEAASGENRVRQSDHVFRIVDDQD